MARHRRTGIPFDYAYVGNCLLRMKTKLTLSVSSKSVQRAKAIARRRGVPLSRLVEEHFDRLAPADGKLASDAFFSRWQGSLKLDPAALADERAAAILAKHVR